jgi:hypothetical protein
LPNKFDLHDPAPPALNTQGILFILGRNPYDVGDRISINQTDEQPMADGVFTWYVENVSLYYTTLRLGATNEVATVANSAMANARIVNAVLVLVECHCRFRLSVLPISTAVYVYMSL